MNDTQLIDALGGPSKIAAMCEITPSAVTQWKEKGIPKPWMKFFRLQHPELFDDEPPKRKKQRKATQ